MSAEFPVKSKTVITPSNVSIIIHSYSNRLFIIVSEIDAGSPGTLIEFQKEANTEIPFGSSGEDSIYDIKVYFGSEKPEILLAARVLGSRLHTSGATEKPILFGIGLKRFDKPVLEEAAASLIEIVKGL